MQYVNNTNLRKLVHGALSDVPGMYQAVSGENVR